MRILIVTPTFFPVRGGTEQVVFELAKRFSKDHNITIVTPRVKNSKPLERLENIDIIRFKTINLPILNAIFSQIVLFFLLRAILKKNKIDLIHMFHIYNLGGAVVLLKKFFKVPLVTTLAGWDTYDPIRPLPRVFWPYLGWVMNNSDSVTTMCGNMVKNAKKQGCRNRIEIIPHGTDMFNKKGKSANPRRIFGIDKKKRIVFSLQRLFPRKGLQYLIRSVPLVSKKVKDVVFLIGGKGPELERLKKMARELKVEDKIIFAGFVEENELKGYYRQSEIFALPSLYEGFGLVYLDALANGLPVVTTKCGGPEDIINNKNGILVAPGDEKAFSEAIVSALRKKWDRQRISQEARKYDWKNIILEYNKVYKKVLT